MHTKNFHIKVCDCVCVCVCSCSERPATPEHEHKHSDGAPARARAGHAGGHQGKQQQRGETRGQHWTFVMRRRRPKRVLKWETSTACRGPGVSVDSSWGDSSKSPVPNPTPTVWQEGTMAVLAAVDESTQRIVAQWAEAVSQHVWQELAMLHVFKAARAWSSATGCDAVLKILTLESAALLRSKTLRSLPVGIVKGDAWKSFCLYCGKWGHWNRGRCALFNKSLKSPTGGTVGDGITRRLDCLHCWKLRH